MSDKNKAMTLSKMYSIARGVSAPVPGMSVAQAMSRLYSMARAGTKKGAGKVMSDSDKALAASKKKKAAFLKKKLLGKGKKSGSVTGSLELTQKKKKYGGRVAKKKK